MRKLLLITLIIFNTITISRSCMELDIEPQLPEFFTAKYPTIQYVYDAAVFYGLEYPEIVTAQALLESGHFTSKIFKSRNNLFGLYDSKNREFYKFDSWQESVIGYRDKVQYKYKGGDYYRFLDNLPYAEADDYIIIVKSIVKKLNI